MQAHCRQFGLNRFFAVCYCAEDYNWISKAEIFPDIRNHFDGTFAVIGDRHQDMELARKHDLKFIGCSYGYGSFGELDSANAIVQKPEEIPDALHLVFAKQHYAS
jgi:phosphoglycolate phosphatase